MRIDTGWGRLWIMGCVLLAIGLWAGGLTNLAAAQGQTLVVDDFNRPDTLYHGPGWESLNPGYWKLQDGALRRRLEHVGDHNPTTSFPWHWYTRALQRGDDRIEPVDGPRDPSLPLGMIWRRDWKLRGNYTLRADLTVRALTPEPEGERRWNYHQPGYGMMGVCFGGQTLYESRHGGGRRGDGSWMALWRNDGRFGLYDHSTRGPKTAGQDTESKAPALKPGDRVTIEVDVQGEPDGPATVTASLLHDGSPVEVTMNGVDCGKFTEGYFGLVARGQLDFQVDQVRLAPGDNAALDVPLNELHVCYPLGDTLRQVDGRWHCKFIGITRSNGEELAIRVADSPEPPGGWKSVPVAGSAPIVSNDFRRYTACVDVALPADPSEKTLYYTVWKDGLNVTRDPREGYLGRKDYVGRLPRLTAPYRVCTLGGHALHRGGTTLPRAGKFQKNWVHGQPTADAYKYFEDYDFQIINWDDDVWYLELLFPPPSTDDACKIITITLANPTTRWQMMRHWNVINPGDHDYGMDDVKGPEQILVRQNEDLGQDPEYMRRNFNLVNHISRGTEERIGDTNPKTWRRWKMPDRDFSLLVMEARLWRSSQDTDLWVRGGWGHKSGLYHRTDTTRTLLGEEQFAWLQQIIRTDTSPLICLTGINCMQPIFTGFMKDPETGRMWNQQDRVAADYAGWAKAGCDRVIELLGSRTGIASVYGDIHLASIVENRTHHFFECSCGPIGRGGSRGLKEGFGPQMTDYDGRPLSVHALYHRRYGSPELDRRTGPPHWNFLEMEFDPRGDDPTTSIRIRNIVDPPDAEPRGGGFVERKASETGRPAQSKLPELATLPNADVWLRRVSGEPICATRSRPDGTLPKKLLADIPPGTQVLITAHDGEKTDSRAVRTVRNE